MTNDQIRENYRQHEILARFYKGNFHGRVWKGKEIIHETVGKNLVDTAEQLRQFVDNLIENHALKAGTTPDEVRLLEGFRAIISQLHDGQIAMLKAHYHAKNQTLTAGELAASAGYSSYSSANVHYGKVGKALFELAPINLPKREDGSPIYTFYLAEASKDNEDEEYWHWKLRPEVSKSIEILGLHV